MSTRRGWAPKIRIAVIVLHALFVTLSLYWATTVVGIAFALLLLLPLPGLVSGRLRTYGWAAMLVAIYASFWAAEWWMPGVPPQVLVVATIAVLDFCAIALYARIARREALA
jgi:uncharacterized membrane protein